MKEKRGNWLKARREELKITSGNSSYYSVRALAERIGMSGPGLTHLENTDAMPSLELGFNLARELGRTVDWVLTGNETPAGIPVLGTTSPDTDADTIQSQGNWLQAKEFVNFPMTGNSKLYALRISENMFAGRYPVDDLLIVDAGREAVTGEEVVVYAPENGKLMVKMLASVRDDKVYLDSTDGTLQRIVRSLQDITFLHPVIGSAKWFTVYKT